MFSQNDEERLVLDFFGSFRGRFLDVGAYDGKTFSNTRALALAGWGGVAVEASACAARKLEALYADRSDVLALHAALTEVDNGNHVELWETPDALSTTETAHREKWGAYTRFERILVPSISVPALVGKLGEPYHFVSVDTEGTSVPLAIVLLRHLEARWPGFVALACVEHDGRFDELRAAFEPLRFRELARNGENLLFGRR
jgi:FkbM family methyltransferase